MNGGGNLLNILINPIVRSQNQKHAKAQYLNILDFSKSIIDKKVGVYNDHPILDVIRALGKSMQIESICHMLKNSTGEKGPRVDYGYLLFPKKGHSQFYDFKKKVPNTKNMNVGKDVILPWPWEKQRLINCFSSIGKGRPWGEWHYDESNHFVELWLPIGIGWVSGGNHSIATGIIQGEGYIKPEETYDISKIYEYVFSDGVYYREKKTNTIINTVNDVRFAAIFEIGRLMVERGISY